MNEHQKRALTIINELVDKDRKQRRVSDGLAFIASMEKNPQWDKKPEEWAQDWCEGWRYAPAPFFAGALGINLLRRKKDKKDYLEWSQGTQFAFKIGHTIHAYPFSMHYRQWEEQVPHNPEIIQVIDARPVSPFTAGKKAVPPRPRRVNANGEVRSVGEAGKSATPPKGRDSGFVKYKILQRENNYISDEDYYLTQDDFVRFLISGEILKKEPQKMAVSEMAFSVKGNSGIYDLNISCDPPTFTCSCPAGIKGQICKHRLAILNGDFSNIINLSDHQNKSLHGILETDEFIDIIDKMALPITWYENEMERIKKEVESKRKELGKVLKNKK